jgi:hypothetical protein
MTWDHGTFRSGRAGCANTRRRGNSGRNRRPCRRRRRSRAGQVHDASWASATQRRRHDEREATGTAQAVTRCSGSRVAGGAAIDIARAPTAWACPNQTSALLCRGTNARDTGGSAPHGTRGRTSGLDAPGARLRPFSMRGTLVVLRYRVLETLRSTRSRGGQGRLELATGVEKSTGRHAPTLRQVTPSHRDHMLRVARGGGFHPQGAPGHRYGPPPLPASVHLMVSDVARANFRRRALTTED